MIRLSYALAGVLLCATPALADQFVTPLGGPSQGVVVERRSGTTGSVNVPVDENNPLPVTVTSGGVAQGSATSGQSGDLMQGAVTTAAPAYTTGQTSPLSLTTGGAARVNITNTTGAPCTTTSNSAPGACLVQIGAVYNSASPSVSNTAATWLQTTQSGALRVSEGGFSSSLNITAAATVKASVGRIYRVILNTVGSTTSTIIDSTGTTVTAANTILAIPATATAGTVFLLDWPCTTGISVVPGTGAVLSISYE